MTHEHIKALDNLIEAVEGGGDAIQHSIRIKAAHAFPPENAYGKCTFHEVARAFYGSLDVAKALHEALLPGWRLWALGEQDETSCSWTAMILKRLYRDVGVRVFDQPNPARAWLLAILKAYRAQMEVKPNQNN